MSKVSEVSVQEIGQVNEKPVLSVCMVAYNHARFIEQAVQGVMMQEVEFPIELVVGEDCSQDKTREILLTLQKRYADRMRLILPERNVGPHQNFDNIINACRGKYIAFIDGDDFWIDPRKLQKQVAVMEANSNVRITFHPVHFVDEHSEFTGHTHPPERYRFRMGTMANFLESIGSYGGMPTGSVVLKQEYLLELPTRLRNLAMGDWPTWVLVLGNAQISCIDEPMGAYRVHSGGAWSRRTSKSQMESEIAFWKAIYSHVPKRYRFIAWRMLRNKCEEWCGVSQGASKKDFVRNGLLWLQASVRVRMWNGRQFRFFLGKIFPALCKARQQFGS